MPLFVDTESLIRHGGIVLIALLIFCNIGLFVCFFLPTGAVLFTVGMLVATGALGLGPVPVCIILSAASVLGSVTSYAVGWKAAPYLFNRGDSRFYKKRYLLSAQDFYAKHGRLAIIAGYFLPIIRTFAPVFAGAIKVSFRSFAFSSIIGSAVWVTSFLSAGYFIASRPALRPWLQLIVIAFILLVTVPLLVRIIRMMRK